MSKSNIDDSVIKVSEEVFSEREVTRASIIKLLEDMSQDKALSNDEKQNRIEIIIEAMKVE